MKGTPKATASASPASRTCFAVSPCHHWIGNPLDAGAGTGERSHDDAIGQVESADLDGIEEIGMVHGLIIWLVQ